MRSPQPRSSSLGPASGSTKEHQLRPRAAARRPRIRRQTSREARCSGPRDGRALHIRCAYSRDPLPARASRAEGSARVRQNLRRSQPSWAHSITLTIRSTSAVTPSRRPPCRATELPVGGEWVRRESRARTPRPTEPPRARSVCPRWSGCVFDRNAGGAAGAPEALRSYPKTCCRPAAARAWGPSLEWTAPPCSPGARVPSLRSACAPSSLAPLIPSARGAELHVRAMGGRGLRRDLRTPSAQAQQAERRAATESRCGVWPSAGPR
jgi:hypothetical protein